LIDDDDDDGDDDDDDDGDEQFHKTVAADGVVIISCVVSLSLGFSVSVNITTKEAIKTNNIRMGHWLITFMHDEQLVRALTNDQNREIISD
jgi:hypothetical protein